MEPFQLRVRPEDDHSTSIALTLHEAIRDAAHGRLNQSEIDDALRITGISREHFEHYVTLALDRLAVQREHHHLRQRAKN